MKIYLISFLLFGVYLGVYSQQERKVVVEPVSIDSLIDLRELRDSIIVVEEKAFVIVEDMGLRFEGGDSLIVQFFKKHIRYPQEVKKGKVEGIVVLSFIVRKNGDFEELEILDSLSPKCDKEVLRVAGLMPRWKPLTIGGQKVDGYVCIGIYFGKKDVGIVKRLNSETKDITIEE